jgi:hypothetical protein
MIFNIVSLSIADFVFCAKKQSLSRAIFFSLNRSIEEPKSIILYSGSKEYWKKSALEKVRTSKTLCLGTLNFFGKTFFGIIFFQCSFKNPCTHVPSRGGYQVMSSRRKIQYETKNRKKKM